MAQTDAQCLAKKVGVLYSRNRTQIENAFRKLESGQYSYDDRHRLTAENRGWINSSDQLEANAMLHNYGMDKVGAVADIETNDDTQTHLDFTTNATNEITQLEVNAPAGPDLLVRDVFGGSLSSAWEEQAGTFAIQSQQLATTGLDSGVAYLEFQSEFGSGAHKADVYFPNHSGDVWAGVGIGGKYGLAIAINPYHDRLAIFDVSDYAPNGNPLDSVGVQLDEETSYTITVVKREGRVEAWLDDDDSTFVSYQDSSIEPFCTFGLLSESTGVTFDDVEAYSGHPHELHGPIWTSSAATSFDANNDILTVNGKEHGGEVVFTGFAAADYVAQVAVDLNSGYDGSLYVRYIDADNWYRARRYGNSIALEKMLHGQLSTIKATNCTATGSIDLRVVADQNALEVYVNDASAIDETDSDIGWGYVAVSGWQAKFSNPVAGFSDDDDLDDVADQLILHHVFDSLSITPVYDANGNLTEDANYAYTYDAWNNLVAVAPKEDEENPFATYAYFADNRRAGKTVTGRGDLDGTVLFYYDGQKVIEERNGSGDVVQQYIWGPNHIDELVMIRGENGAYWAFEDANWNLMGLTDASGRVAEEYHYDPYGKMTATRYIAFGDATGDRDVDTADDTAFAAADDSDYDDGNFNRMFDADWDGHIDAFDEAAFDANYELPGDSIIAVARDHSPNGNPYGYTTRRLDPETGLMHYRARTYNAELRQFMQRDPAGYVDGLNAYELARSKPLVLRDAFGLCTVVAEDPSPGSYDPDEAAPSGSPETTPPGPCPEPTFDPFEPFHGRVPYSDLARLTHVARYARPKRYAPYVGTFSDELLLCLFWKESSHRPDAHNPSGAHGLGQMMPLASYDVDDRFLRMNRGTCWEKQKSNSPHDQIANSDAYLLIIYVDFCRNSGDRLRCALRRYGGREKDGSDDDKYVQPILDCERCLKAKKGKDQSAADIPADEAQKCFDELNRH